ncbi:TIGR00375 family protein [Bacillus sp. 179-C3.3 HS]|uniref:TIGR00375 family protein n=1 Tax=Bacillus sp. 179-C3.3 HS TaxID=3232162 RepID=UPI00399FD27B
MREFFADIHIHVGRTRTGRAVKITGARSLTIDQILIEASQNKGMGMIGVIDAQSPEVLEELIDGVEEGLYTELADGGLSFGQTVLLLGSELEINDDNSNGPIHVLAFMPTLQKMSEFSGWLSLHMKNVHLSSQRLYVDGRTLQHKVKELGGLFIPAHIFTPHKSLYGKGVKTSLKEVFDPELIDAVELGLSCDTSMASQLSELNRYPFLTNSDAHSLGKIAREYTKIQMDHASFEEFKLALQGKDGRKITGNYGLAPRLGKYYHTTCEACGIRPEKQDQEKCQSCGKTRWTKGVSERLKELADQESGKGERPPYVHQLPLQFIPGVGAKTLQKLRSVFQTEMNILHQATEEELKAVLPEKTANYIIKARRGEVGLIAGGGGVYGKVDIHHEST